MRKISFNPNNKRNVILKRKGIPYEINFKNPKLKKV